MTDLRDPQDFQRAYTQHAPAMLAAANRVLRDPAAAEDVVQDVFMHLWRNPGAFDARRGALGSYLTMLARSRALDRWRTRSAADSAIRRSAAQAGGDPAAGESAVEPVIRRDGSRRMLRALDALPGEQREAVLLAFGRGLSASEIARAVDVPSGHRQEPGAAGPAEGARGAQGSRLVADGLTMREVCARAGIEAPTLRMWESRHGFPEPQRLPSGHRRYSERDVELIRQVLEGREAGLSLTAAIERARAARPVSDDSVFAGLRRHRPDLQPYLLPKHTLIALSHAIEDECCARAERPVLFGSFQRERFYRDSEARWRELARTAASALVMADFDEVHAEPGAPVEVPIDRSDPVGREWSIVCDGEQYSACLAAWERPGQGDVADLERLFETIWAVEPEVVRAAARISCALAAQAAPEAADRALGLLGGEPPPSGGQVRLVSALTSRMVAYVGGAEARALPAPHS